jgi:hypothetical protein
VQTTKKPDSLFQIETAFQLTEHLKALYNAAIHPDGSTNVVPIDRATATRLAQPPEGIEKSMWLYELCRFLVQKVNNILIALFTDNPPCSMQTCSEMRASEWQYLCAVHDPPKPCCAIDYCCHTLDWACDTLTSTKNFPSRMSLGMENGSSNQQMRQLTNVFRRVYRIFAHAWFQHRDVFWDVESKGGLYVFFKTVCDVYNLIPAENYTVPPEAEGIEPVPAPPRQIHPTVLKKSAAEKQVAPAEVEEESQAAQTAPTPTPHATQRHRQSPSVDAGLISTVVEEPEEEVEKSIEKEKEAVADEAPEGLSEAKAEKASKSAADEAPDIAAKEESEPLADDLKEETRDVTDETAVHAPSEIAKSSEPSDASPAVEPEELPEDSNKAGAEPVEKQKEEETVTEPEALVEPEEPAVVDKEEDAVVEAKTQEENVDPSAGEKISITESKQKDKDTEDPTPESETETSPDILVLTEPKITSATTSAEEHQTPPKQTEETPAVHPDQPTVKSPTDHPLPSKSTASALLSESESESDAKDEDEATKATGD